MKKISALLLALLLLISSWAAMAETVKLAYSSGSLNLRQGPGTKYAANGVVKNGDNITVLEKGKVWSKVLTDDSREGYIKNLYIYGMGKNYAEGTTYYSKSRTGTVKTKYASSTVNVRAGANKSEARVTTLKGGTKVKVLGRNGSWYLIETKGGTQGFISSKFLSTSGSSSSSSSSSKTTTARVTASAVNMRATASAKGNKVLVLAKNTKVTVLSKANASWWKVKYGSKTGYIYSKYLK